MKTSSGAARRNTFSMQGFMASGMAALLLFSLVPVTRSQSGSTTDPLVSRDATGTLQTYTASGYLDQRNPFFQSLGTNGRACSTCHVPSDGWTITPLHIQQRFESTQGQDPLFRTVDGATSPNADVSTVAARRKAYSMLLSKGLIRVGIGIPENAEFELVKCEDPYGFASAEELSLFRRPLPSTNLRFLSEVMWDSREVDAEHPLTIQPGGGNEATNIANRIFDLGHQADDATLGHAQAAHDLTDAQKQQIVQFEMGLTTAQSRDDRASTLSQHGCMGGPQNLVNQNFYIGINDVCGADPYGPFNANAMLLYDAWISSSNPYQRAVARGERLYNTRTFPITGVKGINNNPALGNPNVLVGTCTTCHNTPGLGNHSVALPMDIGLADASVRTYDMPLYTLKNKTTNALIQTTDPGRAMVTGKWADIGCFKTPMLRGLSARPPYFHNGIAATLADVVEFYNTRFKMGMTKQEKQDMIAFLGTL